MKNKNVRGILALAVVTALSFGVIYGSHTFSEKFAAENTQTAQEGQSEVLEELDTEGFDGIEKAVKTSDGYLVTVRTKGYGGDIVMDVAFDAEGKTVTKVTVKEQTETEGVGSKITETEFLSQFEGVEAPVYLPGMNVPMTLEETEEETPAADQEEDLLKDAVLADGDYIAKGQPDDNGLTDQVTMTVKDGKITAVNWDSVGEDGTKKSVMSENGEYVMTEDGPTWKEQAEALAQTLVENQTLDVFTMDEQGKTDAVSGVSISIGGFVDLAKQCMYEAAGIVTEESLTLADGDYIAKGQPDDNGLTEQVTMTVKDGKITAVNWDAIGEDGTKKSVMSENGEYVMTEDGPTWKEQAEALAQTLVENQTLDVFTMDEQGKTDAVSGVSISIGGFVSLAQDCLNQAAGVEAEPTEAPVEAPAEEAPENGTVVDGVSGATISSTAAVNAINMAFDFLNAAK